MNTLIIHDNEGYILSIQQGEPAPREPQGVPFLWADITQGKQLKIVDGIGIDVSVTPHQVILEDIPPSEIAILKQENTQLSIALAELAQANEQDKIETQLAIAELANLVTGGNA